MGGKYTVDACAKSYSQRHNQTAEHPATQLWILIMYIHTRSLFHNLSLSFKNTEYNKYDYDSAAHRFGINTSMTKLQWCRKWLDDGSHVDFESRCRKTKHSYWSIRTIWNHEASKKCHAASNGQIRGYKIFRSLTRIQSCDLWKRKQNWTNLNKISDTNTIVAKCSSSQKINLQDVFHIYKKKTSRQLQLHERHNQSLLRG